MMYKAGNILKSKKNYVYIVEAKDDWYIAYAMNNPDIQMKFPKILIEDEAGQRVWKKLK